MEFLLDLFKALGLITLILFCVFTIYAMINAIISNFKLKKAKEEFKSNMQELFENILEELEEEAKEEAKKEEKKTSKTTRKPRKKKED